MIDIVLTIPRIKTRLAMALAVLTGRVKGSANDETAHIEKAWTPGHGNATFYSFYPASGRLFSKARGVSPSFALSGNLPSRSAIASANGDAIWGSTGGIPGNKGAARELRVVVIPDVGSPYVLNPEPM